LELDNVPLHVLHQVVIEAIPLQDLEGINPLARCLELEAIVFLTVVAQQSLDDLLVVEEVLEDQELANLEDIIFVPI
jgi:hypothetical protein